MKYELTCGDVTFKKSREDLLARVNELSVDYEPVLMTAVESEATETKRSLVCILMKLIEKRVIRVD